MTETEVAITPELLERVLRGVTQDAVLVGGQDLAIRVENYDAGVPLGTLGEQSGGHCAHCCASHKTSHPVISDGKGKPSRSVAPTLSSVG